ncbi:MAG: TetR/AcrR family transcriptional regulator [Gammaproteobacteria bacterium]
MSPVNKTKPGSPRTFGIAIKQERGQVTYDAMIAAGFRLLEQRDLQDISIAELVRSAGYSVGAFYSRFHGKDEFFDALVARHLETRTATQKHLFATLPRDTLLDELIANVVNYYWDHRKFWRAVLVRSVRDAAFWEPIRKHGHEFTGRFLERLYKETGRKLTKEEEANVYFAFQIILGMINSTLINQHGPIFMGQRLFIQELTRAFRLISDFDNIISYAPAQGKALPKQKKA